MAEWGMPTSKTVEWYDPMITAAVASRMSGLEFLRAIMDGELPPPPIASLLGFRPSKIELGQVVFEGTPDESVYNPIGTVHGGLVCTLADTVAACHRHGRQAGPPRRLLQRGDPRRGGQGRRHRDQQLPRHGILSAGRRRV